MLVGAGEGTQTLALDKSAPQRDKQLEAMRLRAEFEKLSMPVWSRQLQEQCEELSSNRQAEKQPAKGGAQVVEEARQQHAAELEERTKRFLESGNVAAPLGAFLGQISWGQQLPAELLRRTDIHQSDISLVHRREHVVPVGPDVLIGVTGTVGLAGRVSSLSSQGAVLGHPLGPAPVHQLDVPVTVVFQLPEGPGRKPVVVIPVEDDGGVVIDAGVA